MADNESNKFSFQSPLGDSKPFDHSTNDQPEDYAHDVAGVPNPDRGEKTNMDMALEPNKFPRQTGHDSLTPEEAQLT